MCSRGPTPRFWAAGRQRFAVPAKLLSGAFASISKGSFHLPENQLIPQTVSEMQLVPPKNDASLSTVSLRGTLGGPGPSKPEGTRREGPQLREGSERGCGNETRAEAAAEKVEKLLPSRSLLSRYSKLERKMLSPLNFSLPLPNLYICFFPKTHNEYVTVPRDP